MIRRSDAASNHSSLITNHNQFLLRVEFDDELFLDGQPDVFALGHVDDASLELFGVQLEPRRDAAAAGRFDGLADLVVLAALLADLNDVPLANLVGGNVDLPAVHFNVSVADELAALRARGGEAERVNDVVEPQLELAQKVL